MFPTGLSTYTRENLLPRPFREPAKLWKFKVDGEAPFPAEMALNMIKRNRHHGIRPAPGVSVTPETFRVVTH